MKLAVDLGRGVIGEPACVRLELENRPENVSVVRAALTGVAEAAGFDEELATDVKTAVSEACNNVVIHAYEGQRGAMDVAVNSGDRVDVVVRDHGTGITRLSSPGGPHGTGPGVDQRARGPGGVQEPDRWRHRGADAVQALGGRSAEDGFPRDDESRSGPRHSPRKMWSCGAQPVPLARHVLGRVARATLPRPLHHERAADLYAINDATAGFAEVAADGHLVVGISSSAHRLTVDEGHPGR